VRLILLAIVVVQHLQALLMICAANTFQQFAVSNAVINTAISRSSAFY
jgi:hypothetical protein